MNINYLTYKVLSIAIKNLSVCKYARFIKRKESKNKNDQFSIKIPYHFPIVLHAKLLFCAY